MGELPDLKWSGSFTVLRSASSGSRQLSGDKILLPQSALEQLLAASPSPPSSGATFTSFDPANPYLSGFHDTSSRRESSSQLPNPLTFRLTNPKNNAVVYAGIREFSAPDHTIGLSPMLLETLGIEERELNLTDGAAKGMSTQDPIDMYESEPSAASSPINVTVHHRQLPKGTYVRLRPLEAGYNPEDWKALLERQLRESFTTLTKNATLTVKGVQGETFRFLADKFEPEGDAICVVDTDIEVDIEALNEEQARETLRRIAKVANGTSTGGELDIWKAVEGRVSEGQYVDYILPSWNRSQTLEIALTNISKKDAVDLFVTPRSAQQRELPREALHVIGNFDSAEDGSKSISLSPTNVDLEDAESVLISVHGYNHGGALSEDSNPPTTYTIRARATASPHQIDPIKMDVDDSELDTGPQSDDMTQCKNCLQCVPKRSMVLHENFCLRNNIRCPDCGRVFKKGSSGWESHWHCPHDDAHGDSPESLSRHDYIFHTTHDCPSCDFRGDSLPELARHRTSVCPGKIILCRFCHLEVPQEGDPGNPSPEVLLSGMTAHELADGARTTECHMCDKIVRLRDMEMHLKHHELDKVQRPPPAICRNAYCSKTLDGVGPKGQVGSGTARGQGPGNDIGLCSLCYGPLYVSMYDPEGKALRRRIERRYLSQLMTGCGKKHCANEWCKTGRSNIGLEAKGSGASAALPLVKPLLAAIPDHAQPMYFCVEESNQRARKVAEMMAAEGVWDLQWCVAAAEAEKGDLEKMRQWLRTWAPSRVPQEII